MSPQERFERLIHGDDVDFNIGPLVFTDNQSLLEIRGRTFHIGVSPERAEVAFSLMVYCANAEHDLIGADLVAEFNAWRLFYGGYRLSVDALTQCLYVSVTKSLSQLETTGLTSFVDDFIRRCVSCTRWCMGEVACRRSNFATMEDGARVLRA